MANAYTRDKREKEADDKSFKPPAHTEFKELYSQIHNKRLINSVLLVQLENAYNAKHHS